MHMYLIAVLYYTPEVLITLPFPFPSSSPNMSGPVRLAPSGAALALISCIAVYIAVIAYIYYIPFKFSQLYYVDENAVMPALINVRQPEFDHRAVGVLIEKLTKVHEFNRYYIDISRISHDSTEFDRILKSLDVEVESYSLSRPASMPNLICDYKTIISRSHVGNSMHSIHFGLFFEQSDGSGIAPILRILNQLEGNC